MIATKYKTPLLLAAGLAVLVAGVLYVQSQKRQELEAEIKAIELQNVRIGVGVGINGMGTGLFGVLVNGGEGVVDVATLTVNFLDDDGNTAKVHDFFPVNKFSFEDSSPLPPGSSKEFGFALDDIVPESWSGEFEAAISNLKFRQ